MLIVACLSPIVAQTQGPFASQIQAALRAFLTATHSWSASQAFAGGATCTGTCTGFGGSSAPNDATYITQVANGSLTAEQALSTLATGLMQVTTTTGVVSSVTTSAGLSALISDETGTGVLVLATTPTLVTPVLGVATITSLNKVTITAPTTSATLTLVDGSSLVTAGAYSITLTSTGATTVTLPTSGTLYGTATGSVTSANLLGSLSDETGTGLAVFATTPTLTTPVLGVATGTSVTVTKVLNSGVSALADGATPALDASLGNTFTLTAAGNRTIAVPTNAVDGQKIVIVHTASGAARTLALNTGAGGFRFGTDITALTETASGKIDYIGAIYNGTASFWDVVSYSKGY